MRIYTRAGDDGTTGLYFGGRVRKDDVRIDLNGDVDEAQASIGFARSLMARGGELDQLLVGVEHDLWVLMAEVATSPENHHKLVAGKSLVTEGMVEHLEAAIDGLAERTEALRDFVVPGQDQVAAALDVARTIVRRAERKTPTAALGASSVPAYLNRLSDLLWSAARFCEGDAVRTAKSAG